MSASHDELPWLPGARYAPHSVVGEGGNAVVYRTYDHDQSTWVAVKMLHKRQAKTPRARQRFLDEARVMQTLDHRNLVRVLDVVGDAARPFFVMELVEGGSLMQWVNQHGPIPPRIAVDLAMQICKGVGAAHKNGVVHRDLKPHNVLITPHGVCKVIDFGIAQLPRNDGTTDVPDAITQHGVSGTLGYMAPEQRKDPRSVDPRADVYGVGATLYTLLTGQTVVDLFIAEREPKLLEGLPTAVIPVLRQATAYRPSDRHSNVQQLARALFDVRNDLPDTGGNALDIPTAEEPEIPPRPPTEAPETVPSDTGAFERRKPATTPPSSLRTMQPAPPTISPPEKGRSAWMVTAASVAIAVALASGAVGAGAVGVRSAEGNLDDAHKELYTSVGEEYAIIDDLNALGADGERLQQLYVEQRHVRPAELRPGKVLQYMDALKAASERHATNLTSRDAANARERLARIEEAQAGVEAAEELWAQRAGSGLGRLAVMLGLARAPQR